VAIGGGEEVTVTLRCEHHRKVGIHCLSLRKGLCSLCVLHTVDPWR
jgi:hypothetical protein